MSTAVQRRRGTTAQHASFAGLEGELTVDTTKDTLVIHDGSTAGGRPLLREDQANLPSSVANGLYTPGTNQVALSTNGTGRLFVDASGNVGVKNTNPSTVVYSGGASLAVGSSSVTSTLRIADASEIAFTSNLHINNFSATSTIFYTSAAERLRITADGNIGIGSSSDPGGLGSRLWIDTTGDTYFTANSTGSGYLSGIHFRNSNGNGEARILNNTGGALTFYRAPGSEAARLDASGRLLVGTSSARGTFDGAAPSFQLEGATQATGFATIFRNGVNAENPATLGIGRSRGTALGSVASLVNGDFIGRLSFFGADGTSTVNAAEIGAFVDGTPGTNDMPGRLVFSSTPSGSASPVEQLRITSDRYVRLASGTGGIQFNGDTAAANALDDYEEGTWTPVPTGWTSITYVSQVGNYVKVGRQITAWFTLFFSGTSAASAVTITGLPFTVTAGFHGGALTFYNAPFDETTGVLAYPEGTVVKLYSDNDGGSAINSNGNASFNYINGFVTYAV